MGKKCSILQKIQPFSSNTTWFPTSSPLEIKRKKIEIGNPFCGLLGKKNIGMKFLFEFEKGLIWILDKTLGSITQLDRKYVNTHFLLNSFETRIKYVKIHLGFFRFYCLSVFHKADGEKKTQKTSFWNQRKMPQVGWQLRNRGLPKWGGNFCPWADAHPSRALHLGTKTTGFKAIFPRRGGQRMFSCVPVLRLWWPLLDFCMFWPWFWIWFWKCSTKSNNSAQIIIIRRPLWGLHLGGNQKQWFAVFYGLKIYFSAFYG